MPVISPSITAQTEQQYHKQVAEIAQSAHRLHIDLSDGIFAPKKLIDPQKAWWPVGFKADFHLMYRQPVGAVKTILEHKPNLIIVHAEAEGDFNAVADFCSRHGVNTGVALLPATSPETILPSLGKVHHVLIFSGQLGEYGGRADLRLLDKVQFLKSHKPDLEIGWDGGVNDQNVASLITGGVDVLNVGGYIQNSADPARDYTTLQRIADETGTT